MTILVADWASFEQVLPIAVDHNLGLEIQEFTRPENIDDPDVWIEIIMERTKSLPVLSIHGPFAELIPASMDPLVKHVAERRFQQAYDIAQKTGAEHLILHSGYFPKTYPREKWIQNSYGFWLDFLKDKPKPGLIHIENVYEDDFSMLKETIDMINDAYNDEMLTLCLDIGHVNANSTHSLEEWIQGLGNRIRYAHLHNNGGILDDHWRFDRGTIDFQSVLEYLQRNSPNAAWSVETIGDDIEPSLLWLQARGYL